METKYDLLANAIAEATPSTKGWWRAECPICGLQRTKGDAKKSLGFFPETGYYHCFRCHSAGKLRGDFQEYRARAPVRKTDPTEPTEANFAPDGFMLLAEEPALSAIATEAARKYLVKRKISRETWKAAFIGVCLEGRHKDRVIVPIFGKNRFDWIGWVGRDWTGKATLPHKFPSGMLRGELLYNQQALAEKTEAPVIIVEGVFDALIDWPATVACLGKPSGNHFSIMCGTTRPIVVALDGDSWSEAEALSKRLQLAGKRSAWIRLPPKTDPGDLQPGELIQLAEKALC